MTNTDFQIAAVNAQTASDGDAFAVVTINGRIDAADPDAPEARPISDDEIAATFARTREGALECSVDLLSDDHQHGDGPLVERAGGGFLVDGKALNEAQFVAFARDRRALCGVEEIFAGAGAETDSPVVRVY
jgi:hypothetical protein